MAYGNCSNGNAIAPSPPVRASRAIPLISAVIAVQYERGVYLPDENIWLDPWDAKPFAFVSHAHSDHIAPHDEIIVSERTARLMQARLPGERARTCARVWRADASCADCGSRSCPPATSLARLNFFSRATREPALHRRLQIAARPLRRGDGMEAGRHSDHGNDLRPAALSSAADRLCRATDRRLLPRGARGRSDSRCCLATR